jgi:arylsulfatase A-like enzyme
LSSVLAWVLLLGHGCQGRAQDSFGRTPNIVVISIDGLRYDRTGFGGNKRPSTPNLDAFGREAIQFDQSFSQSNESAFSHASLFTGRFPSEIAWPHYLTFLVPEEAQTLPEVMKSAGYHTASFNAAGHIKSDYGFSQGVDDLFEGPEFGGFFDTVPPAISWLESRTGDQPFFLFLHGYDLHRPYVRESVFEHPFEDMEPVDPAWEERLRTRNSVETVFGMRDYLGVLGSYFAMEVVWHQESGDPIFDPVYYLELARAKKGNPEESIPKVPLANLAHAIAHYDASILCADTYVGLFLEALVLTGDWEDTLVVVTSDHGEDLQDHGYFNHRAVLFDSTTHVPLLLGGGAVPPGWRGTRRKELVQAVDLLPTLAEVAGLSAPAGTRGHSWVSLLQGEPGSRSETVFQQGVLGHSSARTSTHRLVFQGVSLTDEDYGERLASEPLKAPFFRLFDLRSDPREQLDVLDQQLEIATDLRLEMVGWYASLASSTATRPKSAHALRRLQLRGYW